MKNKNEEKKNRNERGFALYYAVLFSCMILLIGLSIFSVTLKEFLLSSSMRESTEAFYSADSGIECAMYWDLHIDDEFPTTSPQSVYVNNKLKSIMCGGSTMPTYAVTPTSGGAITTLSYNVNYNFSSSQDLGVIVQITKKINAGDGSVSTLIESTGSNVALSVLQAGGSANMITRSIRAQY